MISFDFGVWFGLVQFNTFDLPRFGLWFVVCFGFWVGLVQLVFFISLIWFDLVWFGLVWFVVGLDKFDWFGFGLSFGLGWGLWFG